MYVSISTAPEVFLVHENTFVGGIETCGTNPKERHEILKTPFNSIGTRELYI